MKEGEEEARKERMGGGKAGRDYAFHKGHTPYNFRTSQKPKSQAGCFLQSRKAENLQIVEAGD